MKKVEMKKLFFVCTLVFCIAVFSACAREVQPTPAEDTDVPELTVITIGPNVTELWVEMGFGETIIATDAFSADIPGVPQGIPLLDMMALDVETILMHEPYMIIATEMIKMGTDPLALVAQAGTRVVYVPVANSIAEIIESISIIAEGTGLSGFDWRIIENMQNEIEKARAIAATISERRTVYFEIDSAPTLFTFGEGSFLNEIIEIIGAENIFANYGTWVAVADEQILARNPDVILTNVFWLDDPLGEIKHRPGWDGLNAVINNRVYLIDADASSRPSHNVIKAMWEMARAVYPEYFD
jgi:iron complex transport system substrate-binding protein